jgi:hypothetical protein
MKNFFTKINKQPYVLTFDTQPLTVTSGINSIQHQQKALELDKKNIYFSDSPSEHSSSLVHGEK